MPAGYQLFLEEEGDKPDRAISDAEGVNLGGEISTSSLSRRRLSESECTPLEEQLKDLQSKFPGAQAQPLGTGANLITGPRRDAPRLEPRRGDGHLPGAAGLSGGPAGLFLGRTRRSPPREQRDAAGTNEHESDSRRRSARHLVLVARSGVEPERRFAVTVLPSHRTALKPAEMIELLLATPDHEAVLAQLTSDHRESCAVLYASHASRSDGTVRLLVRDFEFATQQDYSNREVLEAELEPAFVARVSKRARRESAALVFAHSHPGKHAPIFSDVDTFGEERLAAFLQHRHPMAAHAALVVSAGGVRARRLGTPEEIRVVSVGRIGGSSSIPSDPSTTSDESFDCQVRAFGAVGQRTIQQLRIAIVGLGGTGSIVAQELVHLGVRDFLLIDPDVVETTNLNRVANAGPSEVGLAKVHVAGRYVQSVARGARVRAVAGDIIKAGFARELLEADMIFGCTDSHGSRAVLRQIAYQYLIPCIDMGSTRSTPTRAASPMFSAESSCSPQVSHASRAADSSMATRFVAT